MTSVQAGEPISTVEQMFTDDLAGGEYAAGEDKGYWRLISLAWPVALFYVAAAPRPAAPDGYVLRFELSTYPQAPTARPWDEDADGPLPPERWPGGSERITSAFNPGWRPDALYIPMDRLALDGHPAWPEQYAAYMWDAARDVSQYLLLVYELLHDEGYSGVRGA